MWPTHFIVRQLSLSDEDNAELAQLCRDFSRSSMASNGTNNYRNSGGSLYGVSDSPALRRYFNHLKDGLAMFLHLYGVKPEEVEAEFDGFSNVETYRQWATTHAHVNTQVVITYYPHVVRGADEHERGGCLYWLTNDPKPGNWMLRREQQQFEIKPETGTQVVFPGYVNHATNPLFGKDSEKVALVTNIRFNATGSKVGYMKESQIFGGGK